MTHKCLDCKFADWKRTANGRMHPSGGGHCSFEFKMPDLPAAFWWNGWNSKAPMPAGGYIQRKGEVSVCPTHEAKE